MYVNTVVQKTNILLLNILYPIVYWDLIDEMKEVMLLHKKQCQWCYLFHFIF